MQWKIIYVTVGTTRFDELIDAVASARVLDVLQRRGCQKLVIQYGHGRPVKNSKNILHVYDLIIGHAGAGTCMDILNHGRAGIIVINDRLMGNHQTELAQQLSDEGYLYYSNIEGLAKTMELANLSKLKPYGKSNNMKSFVKYLNEMVEA
nr:UDP-N-acetylglucosamine transferase subunit ALG13 homolog [Bactrocera oleae]